MAASDGRVWDKAGCWLTKTPGDKQAEGRVAERSQTKRTAVRLGSLDEAPGLARRYLGNHFVLGREGEVKEARV